MDTPERTQKEIAGRYRGDVGYLSRPHPWRVARFIATFLAIVGGSAAILLYQKLVTKRHVSEEFFSAGVISSSHATLEKKGCVDCHRKGAPAPEDLTPAKFRSDLKRKLHHGIDFTLIDLRCQACHEGQPPFDPKPKFVNTKKYDLHEPNVVENRTCSVCHQEHVGPERMAKVADLHCASCHNDPGVMEASVQKGKTLPPERFHLRPHPAQQIVFEPKRPERGYTQLFPSFDSGVPGQDHPEFQLIRENWTDPNGAPSKALADQKPEKAILRFNHKLHFGPTIPPVKKDQQLDCNYCHKPDPEGRFYTRVNFEANCKACHGLLFDKNNPKLEVPHGDVSLVRNFLRTLPAQYGDYARLQAEKTGERDVPRFVAQQIRLLRAQFGGDGLVLEHDVFFETSPYKALRNQDKRTQANYVGCAYCHQVKDMPNAMPVLTKPILVDRWMPQARFNHAKHTSLKCEECHHAKESERTTDVLMPKKADCAKCHSPNAKPKVVASDCITCHTYHAPPQVAATNVHADAQGSFKEMLLGSNR
jgi:hypothetical protein